jgi:hypothetical protein
MFARARLKIKGILQVLGSNYDNGSFDDAIRPSRMSAEYLPMDVATINKSSQPSEMIYPILSRGFITRK